MAAEVDQVSRIPISLDLLARADVAVTRKCGVAASVTSRKKLVERLMELGIDVLEGKYVAVKASEPVELT